MHQQNQHRESFSHVFILTILHAVDINPYAIDAFAAVFCRTLSIHGAASTELCEASEFEVVIYRHDS